MMTHLICGFVFLAYVVNAVLFAVVASQVIRFVVHRWRYRFKTCMWLHQFFKENDDQLEFDFEMSQK